MPGGLGEARKLGFPHVRVGFEKDEASESRQSLGALFCL